MLLLRGLIKLCSSEWERFKTSPTQLEEQIIWSITRSYPKLTYLSMQINSLCLTLNHTTSLTVWRQLLSPQPPASFQHFGRGECLMIMYWRNHHALTTFAWNSPQISSFLHTLNKYLNIYWNIEKVTLFCTFTNLFNIWLPKTAGSLSPLLHSVCHNHTHHDRSGTFHCILMAGWTQKSKQCLSVIKNLFPTLQPLWKRALKTDPWIWLSSFHTWFKSHLYKYLLSELHKPLQ